ncbi:MAG TPA: D-cysteine desulfhydrase family protein [Thermoanaerobacterales bacterium]|nr:D-cysteine desulfhydrase family protein [Thermoanaerobacterales bacterium]
MKTQIKYAQALLEKMPRAKLGFFPTPLHKLEKLSKKLGVELYLKRDDLTGINVYGGNKMRKLEFLLGDAILRGAKYVITFGATQSNHAMQTVAACRMCNLEPILFLLSIVRPDENDLRGNMLLDKIMGAEVNIVSAEGKPMFESFELSRLQSEKRIRELEKQGHKCYVIPTGGANPIGSIGFISGFVELIAQANKMDIQLDYICHATGSGGTLAGLAAGKKLLESKVEILSFSVSEKPEEHPTTVANLAKDAIKLLGADKMITPDDLNFDSNYLGEGYEIPTDASTEALKLLARTEGILIDPVYTAKAFSGLLDYIEKGTIPQGSKVLFWHTGGATALFAEKQIVGDVCS